MALKYIDDVTLKYFWGRLKTYFVKAVDGKGLSTNDLTDALKKSYDGAVTNVNNLVSGGAEANKINTIAVNGTVVNPDTSKKVSITVPTNVSQLSNDSSYQTASQVSAAIATAVGQIKSSTAPTYGVATPSSDGLMSSTDKSKLDSVASTYATKSELSSHSQNTSNPHKVTASQVGALPLSGGSLTGNLTAPSFQTGTGNANYFQSRKFRGEGDANNYYHAVDFGYAGHDQVDFYEYGGKYVFHRHQQAAKSSGDTVIGEINGNGFVGKVNGHTINADVPTGAKFTDTTYSNATPSASGLMSASDKSKLDNLIERTYRLESKVDALENRLNA